MDIEHAKVLLSTLADGVTRLPARCWEATTSATGRR